MNRRSRGFTIVELIVVISVIAVLAAITIIGLSRYQADARDNRRASSATVIAEALEKYYDANGEYPSCAALTASPTILTTTTLKGVSQPVLVAPSAPSGTSNSIDCSTLSTGGTDFFEYEGDGSAACLTGSSCLAYKLKYKNESDGTIAVIDSRNNTDIDTSGSLTISGSPNCYTGINLSWNTVTNAANYNIQRAGDSGFTVGLTASTASGNSTVVTGGSPGTTYYVRAAANASNGQGNWSNTLTVALPAIPTPTVSFTSSGPTTATASWGSIGCATTYTIERSTSPSMTAPTQYTQAGTSKVFSDVIPGVAYYVRVKATTPDGDTPWSTVQTVTPDVPQPTATPTMSAAMNGTNAEGTAGGTSCTYGTLQYQIRYHSENTGTSGSWSSYSSWGVTTVYSVAALEGYRYVFEADAKCVSSGTDSAILTSAQASVIRTIDQPAVASWIGSTSWGNGSSHTVNYTSYCPSGTSLSKGPSYSGGFRSTGFDWSDSTNYYHNWGYSDSWTRPSGYGSGSPIQYRTNYYCYTTYDSSPNAPSTITSVSIS